MKRLSVIFTTLCLVGTLMAQIQGIIVNSDGDLISGVLVNGESKCSKGNPNRYTTGYDGYFCLRYDGGKEMKLKISGENVEAAEYKIAAADSALFHVVCVKSKVPVEKDNYKFGSASGVRKDIRYRTLESGARMSSDDAVALTAVADYKAAGEHSVKLLPEAEPDVAAPSMASAANNVRAGMLTAGEVNDFAKWHLWNSIMTQSHATYAKIWELYPRERHTLHLTNRSGSPLFDAQVLLLGQKGDTLWQARTDNTGKAELWADFNSADGKKGTNADKVVVSYQGLEQVIPASGDLHISMDVECPANRAVDVMFLVDATGSMGDEIRYMQAELDNVVERVQGIDSSLNIRTGAVFYRDHGDDYLCRISTLNSEVSVTREFMKKQRASGGGDYEEAVGEALMAAVNSSDWSREAVARIAFLVLDAPPHNDSVNVALIQKQLRAAAAQGIRLVPVVCSGMQEKGEYLFRAMALATNGTSLFLTDDSRIGDTHLKPTTDKLEVEMLNDMMVRVISEFSAVPDCQIEQWAQDNLEQSSTDQFVPNPFETQDLEDYHAPEVPEILTAAQVMSLRPNPCQGQFQVVIMSDVENLFLVDLTGKTLMNLGAHNAGDMVDINVRGFSTGIYFVKAFRAGKWYTQKEIVK